LKENKDNIRSATLSKTKSGNFFLSILVDIPIEEITRFEHTGEQVGIDLGVKDFVITSDGEIFKNKHFFKLQEKKIKKLQRQLSRKTKGSNNRNKARIKLAKAFEHLTNQKENYIHEIVNELLSNYDIIFMEDLNVQGMLKNHHLAKAISEVGFGRFKQVLQDKTKNNDKQVIEIDRFYPSSKTCSCCGYIKNDLTLSVREWTCPNCGTHHDRDINAAMNILLEGKRMFV
jgi:putative transposase